MNSTAQKIFDECLGGDATDDRPELCTFRLSAARPKPVKWLVPLYVPSGKLVMVAGDGGHGKSTLTLSLASDLSQGRCALGLDYPNPKQCETLLIQCEDDVADTVLPRVLAAGGNPADIHQLEGIRDAKGKIQPFGLAHYEALEKFLAHRKEIGLVLVDPAGAYIGRTGIDDNKDSELRSLLAPLSQLAEKRNVTIILIKHFIKGATAKAVHKVGGSVAYVNAVRAAFAVVPQEGEPEKKLFLPLKFNIGKRPPGLAFQLQALPPEERETLLNAYAQHLGDEERVQLAEQLFRIQWLGPVEITADEALDSYTKESATKVETVKEWMRDFLAVHAYPSNEVTAAGKKEGFKFDNIKTAREQLKKQGVLSADKDGFQGQWWIGLGKPHEWKRRPDPDQEGNRER